MIEETEKFKAKDFCNSGVAGSYPFNCKTDVGWRGRRFCSHQWHDLRNCCLVNLVGDLMVADFRKWAQCGHPRRAKSNS